MTSVDLGTRRYLGSCDWLKTGTCGMDGFARDASAIPCGGCARLSRAGCRRSGQLFGTGCARSGDTRVRVFGRQVILKKCGLTPSDILAFFWASL